MCKIITLAQLKAAGACADALQRFAAAFGESTPVTPSLACKHADQFDWDWAADNLLSAAAQVEYDQAVKRAQVEYETAAAPARVKYAAAAAPALALLNSPRVSRTASPARTYGLNMIGTASARRSSTIGPPPPR